MNKDFWKDFDKLFVGMDQLLASTNEFFEDSQAFVATYPPYNTIKTDDGYRIELAVAGYKLENIDVSVDSKTLTIVGKKEDGEKTAFKFIHAGLAKRAFTKKFLLGQNIDKDNVGADLKDGILTITLKNLPAQEDKARKVKVKG